MARILKVGKGNSPQCVRNVSVYLAQFSHAIQIPYSMITPTDINRYLFDRVKKNI